MEKIEQIIFYSLEKSVKSYRQFAQRNINKENIDITIDQWLLLTILQNNPDITQQQIAVNVFKDYASITRIIEILVKKKILIRKFHSNDRRRFDLSITKLGLEIINNLAPIILANRKKALQGVSKKEIKMVEDILNKIIQNCKLI